MIVRLIDKCPCESGKQYKDCCYKTAMEKYANSNAQFAFDSVDPNKSFVVNRKGAVVFLDNMRQPRLQLNEGLTTLHVLSVGVDKDNNAMATIDNADGPICYVLPNWYVDWCKTCAGMAMSGVNFFPANVVFGYINRHYSADIL